MTHLMTYTGIMVLVIVCLTAIFYYGVLNKIEEVWQIVLAILLFLLFIAFIVLPTFYQIGISILGWFL